MFFIPYTHGTGELAARRLRPVTDDVAEEIGEQIVDDEAQPALLSD